MANAAIPVKIALTGRMRSGKDSVADYLARQYGFVRFAFGDGIRKVCRELFPDQFANNTKPRALLQGVGQAMRAFAPDVWVNATMRDVERHHDAYEDAVSYGLMTGDTDIQPFRPVITDLRQPNEYDRLRAEGFVIIRVNASDETRIQRMIDAGDTFDDGEFTHETEQHVGSFAVDYEIDNDGSLAELHVKVDEIMADIAGKVAE